MFHVPLCQYIPNINCLWKFLSKIVLFIAYLGFPPSQTVSISIISFQTKFATLTPHGRCGLKIHEAKSASLPFLQGQFLLLIIFGILSILILTFKLYGGRNRNVPGTQHTALESIGGTCCQECAECYAWCGRDQGRGPTLPPRNNSGHAGMFTFNLKHTNNLKLVKKLSPNYF